MTVDQTRFPGGVEVSQLDLGSDTGATSYDALGLLVAAGYSSGDFLPLISFVDGGSQSRTSSTYGNLFNADHNPQIQWDTFFPAGATSAFVFSANFSPSTDQIDVRLYNNTDDEVIMEQTAIGNGKFMYGPTSYTPTTTASPIDIRFQFRNSDNITSVSVSELSGFIGIVL